MREGHFRWCGQGQQSGTCYPCQSSAYFMALILTVSMAALQFWASFVTGSLPLESDAWHMISDGIGYLIGFIGTSLRCQVLILILFGVLVKERMTEMAMAAFLTISVVVILFETWQRWSMGAPPIILRNDLLLFVAILGLLVNVVVFRMLSALGIKHHPGHDHEHHHEHGKANLTLQANVTHTFTDLLSSVAVVGSALVARWFEQSDLLRYTDIGVPLLIVGILGKQVYDILRSWQQEPYEHH